MNRRLVKTWQGSITACDIFFMVIAVGGVVPTMVLGQQPQQATNNVLHRRTQLAVSIEKLAEPVPAPNSAPAAEQSVDEKYLALLEKPLTFELEDMPLQEFAKWFAEQTKVPVLLDVKALEQAGIVTDTPVTFQQNHFRAISGLNQIVRNLSMGWTIRDNILLISTNEEIENVLITRVYNVLDIVTFRERDGKVSFDTQPLANLFRQSNTINSTEPLLDIIKSTCAIPTPGWVDDGGFGTVKIFPTGLMTVSQILPMHREIERLLAAIRKTQADYGNLPTTAVLPRLEPFPETDLTAKFRKRLTQPITLKLVDEPLRGFVKKLSKETEIPILLDTNALEGAGIGDDTPINGSFENVPLQAALNQILRNLGSTFVIRNDAMVVTTFEEYENTLETIVYPIRDLITPKANDDAVLVELELLRDTLQTITAFPKPGWVEDGGVGEIKPWISHKTLIIRQTPEVHEQIESYLTDLRKKLAEVRRSIRIESKPSFPMSTYLLTRDANGKMKSTPDEVVKSIKQLLPDIDWDLAGTAMIVMTDRFIIRHEGRTLQRVAELKEVELNGLIDDKLLSP